MTHSVKQLKQHLCCIKLKGLKIRIVVYSISPRLLECYPPLCMQWQGAGIFLRHPIPWVDSSSCEKVLPTTKIKCVSLELPSRVSLPENVLQKYKDRQQAPLKPLLHTGHLGPLILLHMMEYSYVKTLFMVIVNIMSQGTLNIMVSNSLMSLELLLIKVLQGALRANSLIMQFL